MSPSKAVLDGVAEIVFAQTTGGQHRPDWTAQLPTVAHPFRQLALAHPNAVPLLITRPPPRSGSGHRECCGHWKTWSPCSSRRVHRRRRAAHLPDVVRLLAPGHIRDDCRRSSSDPRRPTTTYFGSVCTRVAVPRLRALTPALASNDGAAELDRFLDLVLVVW